MVIAARSVSIPSCIAAHAKGQDWCSASTMAVPASAWHSVCRELRDEVLAYLRERNWSLSVYLERTLVPVRIEGGAWSKP